MATTKKPSTKKPASRKPAAKKPITKKTTTRKPAAKSATTTKAKSTKKVVKKPASSKTAKASVVSKKSNKSRNPLKWFHLGGAALLTVLAAAVLLLADQLSVFVTTHYLTENQLAEEYQLLPAVTELFSVNITYLIAAGLLVAALWRVLLATKLSGRYQKQLTGKFTSLNWIELSVLAPFVFMIIGLVVGVRNLGTLLLLLAIPAGVAVLGYLSDRYNMIQNRSWLKTKIAVDALLLPWIVIGVYILHTFVYGFVEFSIGTYILLLAGLATYGLLATIHKKRILGQGKFADFIYGEKWISVLHVFLLVIVAALAFV